MNRANKLQELQAKRLGVIAQVDTIIRQLENTIRYIKHDKQSLEEIPLEGELKIEEREVLSSIVRHLTSMGEGIRTDILLNRAVSIGILRSQLNQPT